MPLLDHFHPPLSVARHWQSLHSRWAGAMADALNEHVLPRGYYAEEQIHIGSRVEVDVAAFDRDRLEEIDESGGSIAVSPPRVWTPSAPPMTMPAIFPDSLEVQVISTEGGPNLVAAVELVSPGNKDRPEFRRAFAAKCASYIHQGIGLIIVDIVTSRLANLHNELVELMEIGADFLMPPESLYAVAYRPVRRPDLEHIEAWPTVLQLGLTLPTLPLSLDKAQCVPLALEATYMEACQRRRLA
jgi:hypothetical protein